MFKASRYLLAKLPVRPVVNVTSATGKVGSSGSRIKGSPNAASEPIGKRGLQVTPIGLAFIVGGIAFGVYLFKPTSRMPTAAMDTFKPQIAIIFGFGDSQNTFKQTAEKLGFAYIDVNKDLPRLDLLVKNGSTKFFIEGFKNHGEMESMAMNTVQPDIILDFEKLGSSNDNPRQIEMPKPSVDAILDIVKERNLI